MQPYTKSQTLQVTCKTVDSFQGQECDIVLFLAVRSNKHRKLGFLDDVRQLNVAITRPKYSLLIICDCDTVSFDPTWADLLQHARSSNVLYTKESCALLQQVVKRHTKQQNDIESLKNPTCHSFEDCIWSGKISFTHDCSTSFQKIKSMSDRKMILSQLLKLAIGKWTDRSVGPTVNVNSITAISLDHHKGNKNESVLENIVSVVSVRSFNLVWAVDLQVSEFTN